MLVIVDDANGEIQAVDKRRDRAIARPGECAALTVDLEDSFDLKVLALACTRITRDAVLDECPRTRFGKVLSMENLVNMLGRHLLACFVGDPLNCTAELDLQAAGQGEPMFLLQQVGYAALARLAVDADHGIIASTQV